MVNIGSLAFCQKENINRNKITEKPFPEQLNVGVELSGAIKMSFILFPDLSKSLGCGFGVRSQLWKNWPLRKANYCLIPGNGSYLYLKGKEENPRNTLRWWEQSGT